MADFSLEQARQKVRGPVVPMTTPCNEDGSIDYEGVQQLTRFYVEHGINTIIAAGTTGYCYTLTPQEHKEIVRTIVETANGEAFIIGGATHSGTRIANHLADICQEVGTDALLVAPPYYGGTAEPEGTYQHYKSIAQNHDLGVFVYNRGPIELDVPFFERLAEIHKIIGIKDASGDYNFARDVGIALSDRFVLVGGGSMRRFLWQWLWGGQAYVTGIANLVPEIEHRFFGYLEENDIVGAKQIIIDYEQPFFEAMMEYNWWASLHLALKIFGLPAGKLRLPLVEPPAAHRQKLEQMFRNIGLLD